MIVLCFAWGGEPGQILGKGRDTAMGCVVCNCSNRGPEANGPGAVYGAQPEGPLCWAMCLPQQLQEPVGVLAAVLPLATAEHAACFATAKVVKPRQLGSQEEQPVHTDRAAVCTPATLKVAAAVAVAVTVGAGQRGAAADSVGRGNVALRAATSGDPGPKIPPAHATRWLPTCSSLWHPVRMDLHM